MADQLAQFITALEHAQITRYVGVGSVAIWVFDYIHNLPEEIEYVWFSKLTPVKAIYMFSRLWAAMHYCLAVWYTTTFTHTASTCKRLIIVTSTTGNLNAMLAELMIYLHIHAFSHKNPVVGWYLAFQYVALFTSCSVLLGLLCSKLVYVQDAIPGLGCIPLPNDLVTKLNGSIFIAPLASEFMVILVALLIVISKYRGLKSAVLNAFLRDGLIYPFGLLIMSVATITLSYTSPNTPIKNLFGLPVAVFHNIITARLILHLRYISKKTSEAGTTRGQMPTIQFAARNPRSSRSFATWTTGWSESYATRESEPVSM